MAKPSNSTERELMPGGEGDNQPDSRFNPKDLKIGVQTEQKEHGLDPKRAKEVAKDHLVNNPKNYSMKPEDILGFIKTAETYFNSHTELTKEESLEKMALIYRNESKPTYVWAVRNRDGRGPYTTRGPSGKRVDWDISHLKNDKRLNPYSSALDTVNPPPNKDLDDEDWIAFSGSPDREEDIFLGQSKYDRQFKFGFERPEHAVDWFGEQGLRDLASQGFKLVKLPAIEVRRSSSGRQIMYKPHKPTTFQHMVAAFPELDQETQIQSPQPEPTGLEPAQVRPNQLGHGPTFKSELNNDELKKGIMAPLVVGTALAVSQMTPKLKDAFDRATAPVTQQQKPVAPFNPKTLHPDMHGIAFLESSYGKRMNHAAHSGGEFETAYGPLGFKPSTAFDEFTKAKHLTDIYPHLKDKDKFLEEFKKNPDFYNLVAGTHWNRLKQVTGSVKNASFAWTHGLGAYRKATPAIVDNDEYVNKYSKVSESKPWAAKMQKSESFKKWKVGAKTVKGSHVTDFDYNHMLEPAHLNGGYSVKINEARLPGSDDIEIVANLQHPVSRTPVGWVGGAISKLNTGNKLFIENATISAPHRGRGFGKKLYEVLLAHAHNHHNVIDAIGGVHSSMARRAHDSIKRDYETGYEPEKNVGKDSFYYPDEESWAATPDDAYDEKWGKYRLTLKIENNLSKALKEYEMQGIVGSDAARKASGSSISKVDHSLIPETPHKENKQHFEQHVNKPEHTPPVWNSLNADPFDKKEDYELGGAEKMVFNIDNHKYLVKSGEDAFVESACQGVYHAAGLGHLMQQSHVSHIPTLNDPQKKVPACVIKLDPNASLFMEYRDSKQRDFSQPIHAHKTIEHLSKSDYVKNQARQLVLMDYLLANHDRHGENLMIKKDKSGRKHDLLSIDHGYSLDYDSYAEKLSEYVYHTPFANILYGSGPINPDKKDYEAWESALEPIVKNKAQISAAFYNHLSALQDPVQRKQFSGSFDVRLRGIESLYKKLRDGTIDQKQHFLHNYL
jgi:predicted GNAT family acetyltransferase